MLTTILTHNVKRTNDNHVNRHTDWTMKPASILTGSFRLGSDEIKYFMKGRDLLLGKGLTVGGRSQSTLEPSDPSS